ncbi:DUF3293 domain-containing protein [Deinococcus sp. HMF7620]|uniref:DUF3293 domain-containing protein n=1 Tax=Deinococcus arboris TaxID=2682977 RepID=A0A7C9LM11_9DEIO|nr:DUF3293 domain-containing protein [Deinococcus arboris]
MRPDAQQRRAFLAAAYGPLGQRVSLDGESAGVWPTWATPGTRWAIVTAWNPGGKRQSNRANETAQAALRQQVARWAPLPGVNGDGPWREPSVVLRGLSVREAAALGRAAGQLAVVYGVGRRAALVWLERDQVRLERVWTQLEATGA